MQDRVPRSAWGIDTDALEDAEGLWQRAYDAAVHRAQSGQKTTAREQEGLRAENADDTIVTKRHSLREDLKKGRTRKGTRAGFLRRATGEGYTVFEGATLACGYRPGRPVSGQSSEQNARQIQKELNAFGIDAEIIDGPVLWNLNEITAAWEVLVQENRQDKAKYSLKDTAEQGQRSTELKRQNALLRRLANAWKSRAETAERDLIAAGDRHTGLSEAQYGDLYRQQAEIEPLTDASGSFPGIVFYRLW